MPHFDAATVTVDDVMEQLDGEGYCIVEGMLSASEVVSAKASLREVLDEIPFGGTTSRASALAGSTRSFAKTRAFDQAAIHPLLLGVLDRFLGHYQLSAPTGIQIGPGESAQVLHYDASVYPLPRSFGDVVLNTMWALDDFTVENGATRIVPGSHRWEGRQPTLDDRVVDAVMPAGAVIFYGGKVFHGGGANQTDTPASRGHPRVRGCMAARAGDASAGGAARDRRRAARTPARAARLQHLPAVPRLCRRAPPPPLHLRARLAANR